MPLAVAELAVADLDQLAPPDHAIGMPIREMAGIWRFHGEEALVAGAGGCVPGLRSDLLALLLKGDRPPSKAKRCTSA